VIAKAACHSLQFVIRNLEDQTSLVILVSGAIHGFAPASQRATLELRNSRASRDRPEDCTSPRGPSKAGHPPMPSWAGARPGHPRRYPLAVGRRADRCSRFDLQEAAGRNYDFTRGQEQEQPPPGVLARAGPSGQPIDISMRRSAPLSSKSLTIRCGSLVTCLRYCPSSMNFARAAWNCLEMAFSVLSRFSRQSCFCPSRDRNPMPRPVPASDFEASRQYYNRTSWKFRSSQIVTETRVLVGQMSFPFKRRQMVPRAGF
jgi:hypothetical protein